MTGLEDFDNADITEFNDISGSTDFELPDTYEEDDSDQNTGHAEMESAWGYFMGEIDSLVAFVRQQRDNGCHPAMLTVFGNRVRSHFNADIERLEGRILETNIARGRKRKRASSVEKLLSWTFS